MAALPDFEPSWGTVFVHESGKKIGSAARKRYDAYKVAKTIREFTSLGGKTLDLAYDYRHRLVTLTDQTGQTFQFENQADDSLPAPKRSRVVQRAIRAPDEDEDSPESREAESSLVSLEKDKVVQLGEFLAGLSEWAQEQKNDLESLVQTCANWKDELGPILKTL